MMRRLTLPERFAMISFNGVCCTENSGMRRLKGRCALAAEVLEMVRDRTLVKTAEEYKINRSVFNNQQEEKFADMYYWSGRYLAGKKEGNAGLAGWMRLAAGAPGKVCRELEEGLFLDLKGQRLMDMAPSLIECDLYNAAGGRERKVYRSERSRYEKEIKDLKAGIVADGGQSMETVSLLWLLEQSAELPLIFSREELEKLRRLRDRFSQEENFAGELFRISLGNEGKKMWKRLRGRRNMAAAEQGESIFIDTEEWLSTKKNRPLRLKDYLEEMGHICAIRSHGEIPLMEIDNVVYELIPDAVRMRHIAIHGIRLRRYLT